MFTYPRHIAAATLALFLLVGTPAAFPAAKSDVTIIREANPKLVEAILGELDPKFKELDSGKGYVFKVEGYKVVLYWGEGGLQLDAYFTGRKTTLTRVNEWNQKKAFCRAYLDKDGDATLESDIDLQGGVTTDSLGRFFQTFVDSLKEFSKHLD